MSEPTQSIPDENALLPKKLPPWAYLLWVLLAAGAAMGLRYVNPQAFPLRCTLPAVLVYLGLF